MAGVAIREQERKETRNGGRNRKRWAEEGETAMERPPRELHLLSWRNAIAPRPLFHGVLLNEVSSLSDMIKPRVG